MVLFRVILAAVFGCYLFALVDGLRSGNSMDYLVLQKFDLGYCYWLLIPPMTIAMLGGLVYVWSPSAILFRVAQGALILDIAETLLLSNLTSKYPAIAREAYVASRNSRGLQVNNEMLAMMNDAGNHIVLAAVSVALCGLWLYLLYRVERYRREGEALEASRGSNEPAPGSAPPWFSSR